jgi:putative ABC transport system ATP-binding protein
MNTAPAIIAQVRGTSKEYKSGDSIITALQPTDLQLRRGQLTLIIGPSGSGKTTLLSLLGCVIYPTKGEVEVNGVRVNGLPANKLAALRLEAIGFIFQSFNLIAPLDALQNVMLPLRLQKVPERETRRRAEEALRKVSMWEKAGSLPRQLSGGQQQRVAIARALVTNPPLLLCDEPTASLDAGSVEAVMRELKGLSQEGKSVAVVTHDQRLMPYADRVVAVNDGKVDESDPAYISLAH